MTRLSTAICLWVTLGETVCIAQAPAPPITNETAGILTIVGMPSSAPSIYAGKEVKVQFGNKFRYDLGAQTTQTPIGSASLPGSLGISAAAIAKLPTALAQPAAPPLQPAGPAQVGAAPPPPAVIPEYPEACTQADTINPWPSTTADQVQRITKCWNGILGQTDKEKLEVVDLRTTINQIIRRAGTEQRCYTTNLWNFRQQILNLNQATTLVAFAAANATPDNASGCQLSNSEALAP